ncbi:M18 family aminopeptidase [Anaerococcus sp. mt242]|uniref:M18 family aminopeptidase n=1 Tax=Anaerococcus sp. mt242 TaxID=2661917 RepID=UPI001933D664|nr:M18 family aminopeptidase [Anaerococcus sp. mt242]MBM0046329.1 M18 family aminopeptidase [Anaerococcus sp. mt242]
MNSLEFSKDLIKFIDESPLNYFAVANAKKILTANGFKELKENEKWDIDDKGKYFVSRNDTALIAFTVGEDLTKGFDIIGSHTDSPTFKVKSNAEINDSGYLKINIEPYGGMIYSTWTDRTLSLAGKVSYKKDGEIKSELVNIDKDLLTVPNAAIHMNREVNKGFELNPQNHLYPIIQTIEENFGNGYLEKLLAEEIGIKADEILDFDLGLYDRQKGAIINNMYQIGRIDNLGSVHASLMAFVDADVSKNNVLVLNDNEEIGSRTPTGAFSPFLRDTLKRLCDNRELDDEDFYIALANTYLISADQAHAIHPNFKDYHDPTNPIKMNRGLVIKTAANGAYSSNIASNARLIDLANSIGCKIQKFHNRNDKVGGSTIGPIASTGLGINSIDVGEPILAMHSIRELGGIEDHFDAYKIYKAFYETNL